MKFVIRNNTYTFTNEPEPTDEILKEWPTDKESERFQKYVKEMKLWCGDPAECKFPGHYYFGNIRPWDYEQIMEHGQFHPHDEVLECGALHSYFCIWLAHYVKHYTATDSFYWAQRDYAKNPELQTTDEWCEYVMKKGAGKLLAEEAELQKLSYPSNFFDEVINISVIEHVHDDRKGVEEMMRVLKPGGTLLLTTEYNPNHSKPYSESDGSYYRIYDTKSIAKLFEGFNVEVTKAEGGDNIEPGKFTTLFLRVRK